MANCKYCGEATPSDILSKYSGYCKVCDDLHQLSSNPYSVWNNWTAIGFILCLNGFIGGYILNWFEFANSSEQNTFTLAFGLLGLAIIIIGIVKSLLRVMEINNKDG